MKKLTTHIRYFLLVIVALLFSSYGNKKSHPHINEMIVEGFAKRYVMFDYNPPRFKNYKFYLNIKKYKGNYISKSGLFHPNDYSGFTADQKSLADDMVKTMLEGAMPISSTYEEKEGSFTAQGWIEHGGFSADVPEIHASLRHFYDPTRNENDRYLTDEVNNAAMLKLQSYLKNPEINGVDWALGDKAGTGVFEQNYSWENGKKYMKAALEEVNPEKRDNYMAKAWRCLGETLHMIADNGCPPHVRNDAHPLGNVDPYEEYIEATDVRLFNTGKIPEEQRKEFVKSETVRKIAHELAVFTNENFFSNETISGDSKKLRDVKQIAHPNYVYNSPKLQNMVYEDEYYDSQVGENQVFHCTDKWIFSIWNVGRTTAPYIDGKCIQSQAKVLVPTIVEAGINVMKLYIPELKVEITSVDAIGNVSGIIVHKPDKEYPKTILYTGPVTIKNNSTKVLGTIMAENGRFSGKISRVEPEVCAEIEFGGVFVCSEKVSPSLKDLPMKRFSFQIYKNSKAKEEESLFLHGGNYFWGYEGFNISTIDNSFGKDIPCFVTVSGNRFTIKQNYQSKSTLNDGKPKAEKEILAEGELNKEKTLITSLKVTYYHRSTSYSTTNKSFLHLKNLPIRENGRLNFRLFSSDLPANQALDLIESLSQEYIINYPGEPTTTHSMSKSDLNANFSWDLYIDFSPNRSDELFK